MHRSLLLFVSSAFIATAFAQQPSPANARPRVRRLPYGLQGNVHTVMTKIEQLRPDPRKTRQMSESPVHTFMPPVSATMFYPTWVSFDEKGTIVEQGNVSPDGKFASLTRSEGNTSVTTVQLPGKAPEVSEHRTTSNAGKSTTETYRDGQLTQKTQSSSSGGGHHFEQQIFDAHGKLLHESSTDSEIEATDHTYTTTYHDVSAGPNGVTQQRKIVHQISADRQSVDHSEYDGNGNVLCTLRVSGASVVYSVMLPEAKSSCHANVYSKQESRQYLFSLYPN